MRKAVVILPTYNEGDNLASLIDAIFKESQNLSNWNIEILVVDSRSTDQTKTIIEQLSKKYRDKLHFLETKKEGLGKAYINGFTYAIKNLNPYVIFEMDADWSHNPKDIPDFLKKIEEGADFVIGSRYMKGGSIPANWALHRKLFSIIGNLIVRFGFMKPKITEWTNGYRAIKTWVIKGIINDMANYSGYVFQIAFIDKALKKGTRIALIPINFKDREKGVSKINTLQYISQMLMYVFLNSSFIKYVIVGIIGFVIDFGISYILIEILKIKKNSFWLATIFSSEMAIISNFILNNFWSFSHKKLEPKISLYIFQFFKFNIISSGSILIQAGGIQLLSNIITPNFWYIYKVLIIAFIIIPYSYILYNKVIWKEK